MLLGVALMIMTAIIARRRNYPKGRMMSLREIWKATKDALLGLMTCIIIVGGVIFGWFTATESAAVAVVYAFIVTFFVYREIPLRQFGGILRKSLRTIAMVMALISTASMFGWLLAYLKIPTMVTNLLLGISDNRVVILLLINAMCLVLGCIMDMGPLILILTPILLPVATQLGMMPVQFGRDAYFEPGHRPVYAACGRGRSLRAAPLAASRLKRPPGLPAVLCHDGAGFNAGDLLPASFHVHSKSDGLSGRGHTDQGGGNRRRYAWPPAE